MGLCRVQAYHKAALLTDPSYKAVSENLAVVLTDLGTSLKLSGNIQEGLQKYYDALKADNGYAVRPSPQAMESLRNPREILEIAELE